MYGLIKIGGDQVLIHARRFHHHGKVRLSRGGCVVAGDSTKTHTPVRLRILRTVPSVLRLAAVELRFTRVVRVRVL